MPEYPWGPDHLDMFSDQLAQWRPPPPQQPPNPFGGGPPPTPLLGNPFGGFAPAPQGNFGAFSRFGAGTGPSPFGLLPFQGPAPSYTARPGGGGGYGFANPLAALGGGGGGYGGGGGHVGSGAGAYGPKGGGGMMGYGGYSGPVDANFHPIKQAPTSGFNSPIFKQFMTKYEDAYAKANEANEKRYGEILGGYQGLYDQTTAGYQGMYDTALAGYQSRHDTAIGLLDQMSSQNKDDITALYGRERSRSGQSLADRGLGNTTVVESVNRGLTDAESAEQRRLSDQVLQQRAGMEMQLQGDTLAAQERLMGSSLEAQERLRTNQFGFQERRTDLQPDMGLYAQLAQLAAAGGGAGMGGVGGYGAGGGAAGFGGSFGGGGMGMNVSGASFSPRADGHVNYNGGAVGSNVARMIQSGHPTMRPNLYQQQVRTDLANYGPGYNPLTNPTNLSPADWRRSRR